MTWWQWLVFAGSAVTGAVIRLGVSRSLSGILVGIPFGTFVVNMVGCVAIGVVWTLLQKVSAQEWVRLAIMTGALGSLTTFSTFVLDILKLIQSGEILTALLYGVGSVVVGIALVALGAGISAQLLQ